MTPSYVLKRPAPAFLRGVLFCLISALPAAAEMTPGAPVKNFRLPRFADNGYTQWVLKGGQGIYDSEDQVRVVEMGLRVYSADERMALEMALESPEATLLLKKNQAISDSALRIDGVNFELSGRGWRWDGDTKVIEVDDDVEVRFTQDLSGSFDPGDAVGPGGADTTIIRSERLRLQTTPEVYRFLFSGSVRVHSGTMSVTGSALLAIAEAPEGGEGVPSTVAPARIDAVRQIIVRKDVVIEQEGRVARAGEAEFLPADEIVYLRDLPGIEVPGAYVSGAAITLRQGAVEVEGSDEAGRAQTILTRAGGLGLAGSGALTTETIVLADEITMKTDESGKNVFSFTGAVEVMSGDLQMVSDSLLVHAVGESPVKGADEALEVGEVQRILAEGAVRIERGGQIATGEKVVFYPAEERAVLSGDPRVRREDADVRGARLHLFPDGALAESDPEGDPVRVTLPVLPDLGYNAAPVRKPETDRSAPVAVEGGVDEVVDATAEAAPAEPPVAAGGAAPAPEAPSQETVVRSRSVRMIKESDLTRFRFSDAVEIGATNLTATCDRMDVITHERKGKDPGGEELGLRVSQIEAEGAVVIDQGTRRATSEKAVILPDEGKLVLEGDAAVKDERGSANGHRLTLLQGERRAIVEGNKAEGERARITLPGLSE